jgi:hypothetical protein
MRRSPPQPGIPMNPALELRTSWGASLRRRVVIPSTPQGLRLAAALDRFKPGSGTSASSWRSPASDGGSRRGPRGCSRPGPAMHVDRSDGQRVSGRRDVRDDLQTGPPNDRS